MPETRLTRLLRTYEAVEERLTRRIDASASLEEPDTAVEELKIGLEEMRVLCEELKRTSDGLTSEQRRYADFLHALHDAYLVLDEGGVIRELNIAAARFLGWPQQYLEDKPIVSYVAYEERTSFRDRWGSLKAIDGKTSWHVTVRPRTGPPVKVVFTAGFLPNSGALWSGMRWLVRLSPA